MPRYSGAAANLWLVEGAESGSLQPVLAHGSRRQSAYSSTKDRKKAGSLARAAGQSIPHYLCRRVLEFRRVLLLSS
jgi:hypothetical protein